MSWIDLHIHSIYSNDGDLAPEELVRKCKESGIRTIAVADHNTVKAIPATREKAEEMGIEFIPAIELDCMFYGKNFHVLGYGIDAGDARFEKIENELAEGERASSAPRIQLVQSLGIVVDEERAYNLAHNGYVTGEMIAEVALKDDRNKNNLLLKSYRNGGNRSNNPYVNFFWDICSQGKPADVPIPMISMEEAIEVILSTGGIPVLAHPGNNVKEDEQLLEKIVQSGIQGIEVYSSYHSEAQISYYEKKAREAEIIVTAGSDFHGKTKPSIQLGENRSDGKETSILTALHKKLKK